MRRVLIVMLGLAMLVETILPALAAERRGVVTAGLLNLRSAPSTSAAIIGHLPRGTEVTVLEIERPWLKIRTPNHAEAWVAGRHVRPIGPGFAAPDPASVDDLRNYSVTILRQEFRCDSDARRIRGCVVPLEVEVASRYRGDLAPIVTLSCEAEVRGMTIDAASRDAGDRQTRRVELGGGSARPSTRAM